MNQQQQKIINLIDLLDYNLDREEFGLLIDYIYFLQMLVSGIEDKIDDVKYFKLNELYNDWAQCISNYRQFRISVNDPYIVLEKIYYDKLEKSKEG